MGTLGPSSPAIIHAFRKKRLLSKFFGENVNGLSATGGFGKQTTAIFGLNLASNILVLIRSGRRCVYRGPDDDDVRACID